MAGMDRATTAVQQSHAQDYAEFVPFMRARYNCSGADPDEPTSACPVVLFGGSYGGSAHASRSAQPPPLQRESCGITGRPPRLGYGAAWDIICGIVPYRIHRAVWYTMPTGIRVFMRCVISCHMGYRPEPLGAS